MKRLIFTFSFLIFNLFIRAYKGLKVLTSIIQGALRTVTVVFSTFKSLFDPAVEGSPDMPEARRFRSYKKFGFK